MKTANKKYLQSTTIAQIMSQSTKRYRKGLNEIKLSLNKWTAVYQDNDKVSEGGGRRRKYLEGKETLCAQVKWGATGRGYK